MKNLKLLLIKCSIFLTLCIEVTNVPLDILIPIYGNIIGFFFLLVLFIANIKYSIKAILLLLVIFFYYAAINVEYFASSFEAYKAFLYAFVAILFSVELRKHNFIPILESIFFKYLLFITVCFFLGFGIDSAGGSLRIQGLMSEPSALSLILCFLFWTYVFQKERLKLIIVIFVALLTLSITVYFHIIFFYFVYSILRFNLKVLLNIFVICLICIIGIYFLQNYFSDHWLISKASDFLLFTMSSGEEGNNNRAVDLSRLLLEQSQNQFSLFTGNGPNFSVYYYGSKDMLTNTHNLFYILFFNYGIFGLSIGIYWISYALFFLRNSVYNILFISASTYSFINTASGIVNEIYLYSLLFFVVDSLFLYRKRIFNIK